MDDYTKFQNTISKVKGIYTKVNKLEKPLAGMIKDILKDYEKKLEKIDTALLDINSYIIKVVSKKEGITLSEVSELPIDEKYVIVHEQLEKVLQSAHISERDKIVLENKKNRLAGECHVIFIKTEWFINLIDKLEKTYYFVVKEFESKETACDVVKLINSQYIEREV